MRNALGLIRTLACVLALFVGSCTIYYVDNPQPVDANNMYKLPGKYTGSWYIKDSEDEDPADWDSLSITSTYYHSVSRDRLKEAISIIEADSSVIIIDDKVFVTEEGALIAEYAFETEGDSMIIYVEDHDFVEFGSKVFLRKIDYGYLLNTQHDHLEGWWELMFIDTRSKDELSVWSIGDSDIEILPAHQTLHDSLSEYIHASWTTDQVQRFIDNGGFSSSVVTLAYSERLKN